MVYAFELDPDEAHILVLPKRQFRLSAMRLRAIWPMENPTIDNGQEADLDQQTTYTNFPLFSVNHGQSGALTWAFCGL